MSTATLEQVIDAIVADLEANADLPPHSTHRYSPARAKRMDLGNWLIVYPDRDDHRIMTTLTSYELQYRIAVEWAAPAFKGVESNVEDEDVALANLHVYQRIIDRLRTYGDGIPGLEDTTALVDITEFDLAQGGIWEAKTFIFAEAFA